MTKKNLRARNNDGPNETGVSSRDSPRADTSDSSDNSQSKDQTPQAGHLPESSGSEPDNICDPQDHGHVLLAKLASRTKKYHLPAVENPVKPACHHGTDDGRAKDAESWTQVDADSPRLQNKDLCKWCDPTVEVENKPGGQELAGRLSDLNAEDVDLLTDGGDNRPVSGDWPSSDGAVVDADTVSEHTADSEDRLSDSLRAALEDSDCHPDMVRYAESAAERGGTPIINSLRHFHGETDVSRIAEIGTAIEQTLWNDGAQATLDRHGHVDETNSEILREIAGQEVSQ